MKKFDKIVKGWLIRVLQEKTEEIEKLAKDISILNHQINNYEDMHNSIKQEVVEDLSNHLRIYKWNEAIIEIMENYDLDDN